MYDVVWTDLQNTVFALWQILQQTSCWDPAQNIVEKLFIV